MTLKSGKLILKEFLEASLGPLPALISATGEQTFPQNTQQLPKYSQKYTHKSCNFFLKIHLRNEKKHFSINISKKLQICPQNT